MKSYDDIADSIIEKYNAESNRRKRRTKLIRRTVCAGTGLCAAAAVIVTMSAPELSIRNTLTGNKSRSSTAGETITVTAYTDRQDATSAVTTSAIVTETTVQTALTSVTTSTESGTTTAIRTTQPVSTNNAVVTTSNVPEITVKPEVSLTVDVKVLDEAVTLDGITLPSGSEAVTVSIHNADDFNSAVISIDTGGREVIKDIAGRPVADTLLINTLFAGSVSGDTAVFAGAAATFKTPDGDLFTFYTLPSESSSDVKVNDFELCTREDTVSHSDDEIFVIGDMNGDGIINIADPTELMHSLVGRGNGYIPYYSAQISTEYYLPYIASIDAAYIWNRPEELIKYPVGKDTISELLEYCADELAGNEYTGKAYIGKKYYK